MIAWDMMFLLVYRLDMLPRQLLELGFCLTECALFWRDRQTVKARRTPAERG
jgi:hypothetical protein